MQFTYSLNARYVILRFRQSVKKGVNAKHYLKLSMTACTEISMIKKSAIICKQIVETYPVLIMCVIMQLIMIMINKLSETEYEGQMFEIQMQTQIQLNIRMEIIIMNKKPIKIDVPIQIVIPIPIKITVPMNIPIPVNIIGYIGSEEPISIPIAIPITIPVKISVKYSIEMLPDIHLPKPLKISIPDSIPVQMYFPIPTIW